MTAQTFLIAVMLARVCVSEAGWTSHEECTVITHALVYQAQMRDRPVRSQICAYAPNSCNPRREDPRRWIAHLHPERRSPPPGWPSGVSWAERRAMFAALVVTAARAYRGEIPSACPGALHWGSRYCRPCRDRMAQYGYMRAGCGLRNAWWRRRSNEDS
jgi:hypothetical protein